MINDALLIGPDNMLGKKETKRAYVRNHVLLLGVCSKHPTYIPKPGMYK